MRRSNRAVAVAMAILMLDLQFGVVLAADPTPTPNPSGSVRQPTEGGLVEAQSFTGTPIVLPRDGTIVAQTIRSIAAASINDLALVAPTSQALIADASHVATSVTLGPYTAGQSLVFSLRSSWTSQTYLSTSGNAHVLAEAGDRWTIGWEDASDFNYADVTMRVCYQGPAAGCPIPAEQTLGSGAFGNGPHYEGYLSDPVNTATGNYVRQTNDVSLPGRGLPFDFVRSYNSLLPRSASLAKVGPIT